MCRGPVLKRFGIKILKKGKRLPEKRRTRKKSRENECAENFFRKRTSYTDFRNI